MKKIVNIIKRPLMPTFQLENQKMEEQSNGGAILPKRQWKSVSLHSPEQTFTLASYNILSEHLLKKSSYYSKIKPENWQRVGRHNRLLNELDSLDADLLCLQEVDQGYWAQHLEADLRLRGYTICACSWRRAAPIEGVVICARDTVFQQVDESESANDSGNKSAGGCLSDLVASWMLDAGQADWQALVDYASVPQRYCILRLEHRTSGRQLTVGNTHISYQRPPKPDLRAAQAVAMAMETASAANGGAFVLCGDFNSTPESLAYRCVMQMTAESINSIKETSQEQQLPLLKVLSSKSGSQNWPGCGISSAYQEVLGAEPDCTLNLTNNFGCVDFIFYESQHLHPYAALEVPSWYIQREKDCVPDHNLASDHLSIAARLSFV